MGETEQWSVPPPVAYSNLATAAPRRLSSTMICARAVAHATSTPMAMERIHRHNGTQAARSPALFIALFLAEGGQGVDAGGPPGGDRAGRDGHERDPNGHRAVGEGIGPLDAEQHRFHQAGGPP